MLVELILTLLALILILYIVNLLLGAINPGEPARTIVWVCVAILVLLYVFGRLRGVYA
jgi:hypothetical protein